MAALFNSEAVRLLPGVPIHPSFIHLGQQAFTEHIGVSLAVLGPGCKIVWVSALK